MDSQACPTKTDDGVSEGHGADIERAATAGNFEAYFWEEKVVSRAETADRPITRQLNPGDTLLSHSETGLRSGYTATRSSLLGNPIP